MTALVSVSYASHIWQLWADPQLAPFLLISIRYMSSIGHVLICVFVSLEVSVLVARAAVDCRLLYRKKNQPQIRQSEQNTGQFHTATN